MNIIQDVARF